MQAALTRFVQWHTKPGARTVIGTERQLSAEVTLPDGQQVRLYGYADRLEIDDQGAGRGDRPEDRKYPPPDKDLPENAQLGL